MDVIIRFNSGEITEIIDALSIEIHKDNLTCLGNTEFHSIYLNTVNNVRIVNGPDLHALFHYLDKCNDGELSDDALLGYVENEVIGWNHRKNIFLNPQNTVRAYLAWSRTR